MPPTDPRVPGITPSKILPPPVGPLDLNSLPIHTRSRSSDKPLRQRKRLCRHTAWIGPTQFRCDLPAHDLNSDHTEKGVLTDRTGRVIMKYHFSWKDLNSDPFTIRVEDKHATKPNQDPT